MAEDGGRGGSGVAVRDGVVINGALGQFTVVEGELTEKERAFVVEYVANGGNGTKAAAAAGYEHPASAAYKVKRRPAVREAIKSAFTDIADGLTITAAVAARRVAEDVGQPGDITLRASVRCEELADKLRAIVERDERRAAGSIPDGSGQVTWSAEMVEIRTMLEKRTAPHAPREPQPIEGKAISDA